MSRVGGLTPDENERLALLAEECAEVIQIVMKIQRHGYSSRNPDGIGMAGLANNRKLLEKEIGDVSAAVKLLDHTGDVSASRVLEYSREKLERVGKWLHLSANLSAVAELLAKQ